MMICRRVTYSVFYRFRNNPTYYYLKKGVVEIACLRKLKIAVFFSASIIHAGVMHCICFTYF